MIFICVRFWCISLIYCIGWENTTNDKNTFLWQLDNLINITIIICNIYLIQHLFQVCFNANHSYFFVNEMAGPHGCPSPIGEQRMGLSTLSVNLKPTRYFLCLPIAEDTTRDRRPSVSSERGLVRCNHHPCSLSGVYRFGRGIHQGHRAQATT